MKIKDIANFNNLKHFVADKIERFKSKEKSFSVLFDFMFEQEKNVMAETTNGFRISKTTYGECKERTILLAKKLKRLLSGVGAREIVGLYMDNSLDWIQAFWAILMCGYNPLLMNLRLPDEQLEVALKDADVKAVISDGKAFSVNTILYQDILEKTETDSLDDWGDEIYFMSSGTTDNVKLCAYTPENFYYQVSNSLDIVKTCPQVKANCEGYIKLLALLPLYHVFGFIAVYIWFGFFSRTFVFLRDLNPQTILNTVKKHKVTHIFAVPMVWETIYKQAIKTIRARGDKTYNKFLKAKALISKKQKLGTLLSKIAFKEIREKIFGDSIRFLISGGSSISTDTLEFLNAVGYFTVNGYGMTEVAITSVETSKKRKERNLASIGLPFGCAQYKISDSGELLVKSKARASKIITNKKVIISDVDEWFNTSDMAYIKDGRYYLTGRKDDLIISSSGENISPQMVEDVIKFDEITEKCLVKSENGAVLILQLSGWLPANKLKKLEQKVLDCLKESKFYSEVKKIFFTRTKLVDKNEFKVSRTKIAKKLALNQLEEIDVKKASEENKNSELEAELINIFKEVLGEDVVVGVEDDFFIQLNGSSLDYFELVSTIKDRFNLRQNAFEGMGFTTVKQFATFIMAELK